MPRTNISIDIFNSNSIDKAIAQLDAYGKSLERKRDALLEQLGNLGLTILSSNLLAVNPDGNTDVSVSLINNSDGKITISVGGSAILFIEFGTGIRYSESQEAKSDLEDSSEIVSRGTWGKHNGSNPFGWWYPHDGKYHHTYGSPAQIPVYGTKQELINRIEQVCREIFR